MFINRMYSHDGKTVGEGSRFERIRRVTGYLLASLDRFNDGKRAEEHDRVKHISFKDNKDHNEN